MEHFEKKGLGRVLTKIRGLFRVDALIKFVANIGKHAH